MATSRAHPEMCRRMDILTSEAQTLLARYLQVRIAAGEVHAHNAQEAAVHGGDVASRRHAGRPTRRRDRYIGGQANYRSAGARGR